jgi:Amt family ammonium transporter
MEPTLWAVLAATGALWIRVGFAVHAAGLARSKNSAGAVIRHLTDAAVALLAFWAVGFAIAASGHPVFGLQWRALFGIGTDYSAGNFLAAAMILIATGIVPGVVAERCRFWPALAASALLGAVVIPVAMLWSSGDGWLSHLGYRDPGGAGWLHLAGACCAAVGARVVGPRTGKFNRDGSSTAIPGHSVPLAGLGVVVHFVGFFIFLTTGTLNPRTAPAAAMNVLLAAAAGAMAAVVLSNFRYYKPDVHLTYAGLLGGLVAISAAGPAVGSLGAVIIGAVAGVIVPLATVHIDLILRLDDPSGNVAVHGVGALWGLLATPLFAKGLTFADRSKQFGTHLLAIVSIAALATLLSLALWLLLKRLTKLRASEADEFDGLDLAEHDIGAYPDFQQTMIKSYHLREV